MKMEYIKNIFLIIKTLYQYFTVWITDDGKPLT